MNLKSLFGGKPKPAPVALPVVRDITIGRTVILDTLCWRRLGAEAKFSLDRDTLIITAQGRVQLEDGAYVHRFYTDDHIMLQAVSDDAAGMQANDFTLFIPWSSAYPTADSAKRLWDQRLRGPYFEEEGLPLYHRFWFEDDGDQPPVAFWEEVFDDRASTTPYSRLYQHCMLYSRELGDEGRELLLAITLEPEKGDLSHEIMVGVPLQIGEFKA